MNKRIDAITFVNILLILMFVAQALALIYFNLFCLRGHVGYDSSWVFLKTHLIYKEGNYLVGPWVEQTSPFLDSSLLLSPLFYSVLGNIYISYGFANILLLWLVLICLNSILRNINLSVMSRLFALNLVISPYLINGYSVDFLDYSDSFLVGPAFYNLRVLIILIVVREFLVIKKSNKIDVVGWFSLALCILAGFSSGVYLIAVLLLPYFIYEVLVAFRENSLKPLIKKEAVYLYMLVASVFAGKIISLLVGLHAIDESRTWTPLISLLNNGVAPILGLMKLLGVLPITDKDISIMSLDGFTQVFPILIFGVIVLSIRFAIKSIKTNRLDARKELTVLCLTIIGVNYLVFSLFNVEYGSYIFEERYLISTFIVILILVADYLDKLDWDQLFSKTLIIVLLVCVFANTAISDIYYTKITNSEVYYDEISTAVAHEDAQVIYVWGDDLRTFERIMRVYDLDHIYKSISNDGSVYHFGDYTYYDDNSDYSGPTLLIVSNNGNNVPNDIMDNYVYVQSFESVSLFRAENNPIYIVQEAN